MNQRNKGMAFVLNNNNFKDQKRRKGSEVDVKNVKHVFEEIGYDVIEAQDRKAEEIRSDLDSLKKQIRKSDTSVVLVFMSHGIEEGIYGTDADEMSSATDKSERPEGSTSTTICAGSSNLDDIGYKSLKEVNDKAYDEGSSSWSCELVEFDDGGYQRRGNPDYADMFIGYATCEAV
ncbi:caspase-7-like [Diadema antillarum]|uniref:caspase-7-like n=1 Tax=Diadema antillarum TaxID=105358 RepID=UPI003A85BA3C